MKLCVYQYITKDAYCEKLLLICFKICCHFYPYPYVLIKDFNIFIELSFITLWRKKSLSMTWVQIT